MKVKIKELLTDVITGEWGDSPKDDEGIYVLRNTNFTNQGKIDYSNVVKREISRERISKKHLISGDILIEKSGGSPTQPVGRVVFFENHDTEPFLFSNFTSSLRPDKAKVYPKYLLYLLLYGYKLGRTKKFQNKTTGIINLKLNDYLETTVNINPSLDDQIRIATLLSRAEGLIEQRRVSLRLLDDLVKGVFLEMFGDPIKNEKNLELRKLGSFIVHLTSGGRGWSEYYHEIGTRFIRSMDVQMNYISDDEIVYVIPPNNAEAERTKVKEGDILLTITGSKIGRVAFVPKGFGDAFVSQHVAIIRTQGISSVYLSYYLSMENAGQYLIRKNQYGQSKPGLNFTQIEKFDILFPSPHLQAQFAATVQRIEALKEKYVASLKGLEELYGSISGRAFRGELEVSGIEIREPNKNEVTIKKDIVISNSKNVIIGSTISAGGNFHFGDVKDDLKTFEGAKEKIVDIKSNNRKWEDTSIQQIAEWVKEKYTGYHFNIEMLLRYLTFERGVVPDYFSSEDIRRKPQLDPSRDFKEFVFSALSGENPFIQMRQFFYEGKEGTEPIRIATSDKALLPKDDTGIYLKIVE